MALFQRVRDLTAASVNGLLDKAEDPMKMINQLLRDMEADIADAEVVVTQQLALELRLRGQRDALAATVTKRQAQAERALVLNDEALARKALHDKQDQQGRLDVFSHEHDKARVLANHLQHRLARMRNELSKMQGRRELLVARENAARVQQSVNRTLGSLDTAGRTRGFARMEELVSRLEAEAYAIGELHRSRRSLDEEFKALDSGVDDELAALKERLAQGSLA